MQFCDLAIEGQVSARQLPPLDDENLPTLCSNMGLYNSATQLDFTALRTKYDSISKLSRREATRGPKKSPREITYYGQLSARAHRLMQLYVSHSVELSTRERSHAASRRYRRTYSRRRARAKASTQPRIHNDSSTTSSKHAHSHCQVCFGVWGFAHLRTSSEVIDFDSPHCGQHLLRLQCEFDDESIPRMHDIERVYDREDMFAIAERMIDPIAFDAQ